MKRLVLFGVMILLAGSPALGAPASPYDEPRVMDTTITDKDMPGPPKNQGLVPQSGKKHPYDDFSVPQVDELSEDPKPPAPPTPAADSQRPAADRPGAPQQPTTTQPAGTQRRPGDDLSRPATTGRFERPRRPIEPAAPQGSVVTPPKPAETIPGTGPVTRTPDTRSAPVPTTTQPEPRTTAPSPPAVTESQPRTAPAQSDTPAPEVERPATKRMPWGAQGKPESKPEESKPKFRWGE